MDNESVQKLISNLLTQCIPNSVVPPELPTDEFSGIALVGIAPAETEIETGKVFSGPSGQVLNGCLHLSGIQRSSLWIGNVCPVRLAKDRGLAKYEVDTLRVPLIEALQKIKPKVIIPLGAEPTRALLNVPDVQIMLMRSHVYESPELPGTKIIPSIHPSYALRQSLALAALLVNDLLLAKQVLAGKDRYQSWTYTEVKSLPQLKSILEKNRGQKMVLDTEATSKNPQVAQLFMISFAFMDNPDHGYVIHTPSKLFGDVEIGPEELLDGRNHPTPREDVLQILQEYDFETIIFNILYDYILLSRFGYHPKVFVDPMYAFGLLDENCPKSLDVLGSFFSGIGPYTMNYASRVVSEWVPYAACDAVNTARVWKSIGPRFEDKIRSNLLYKYLMPLLRRLADVSIVGCHVDLSRLGDVDRALTTEIANKIATLQNVVGYEFNHRSNDQLALAFEKLGIPVIGRTKKTGKPSFRKELMEQLADRYPIVGLFREIKTQEKLYSSYIKNIQHYVDEKARVHTNFDIKKTGRLSAAEPALQTLPRDSVILELFAAKPGYTLIKCDFSAAELRWLGFLAGEAKWLNPDLDLHISNASFFYQIPVEQVTGAMRQQVKFLGFGKVYGSGIPTLAKQLNCSEDEAARLEERFFATFPKVKRFMEMEKDRVLSNGFVANYFGLERHFKYDLWFGGQQEKAKVVRETYNFGPQSATAIWTNKSLMQIQDWFEANLPNSNVVLQIHDAIVAEVPIEDLYAASYAMWKIMRRRIDKQTGFFLPVDVSIGPNLRQQTKMVPFHKQNFEEAFDEFQKRFTEPPKSKSVGE
jgi:uracil-DNA glycosylase family 4